jgi:hypothetical protein
LRVLQAYTDPIPRCTPTAPSGTVQRGGGVGVGMQPEWPSAPAGSAGPQLELPIDTNFVYHEIRVMKNVTVTLDEAVARWARIRAAELDVSVSRMLGELLREQMAREFAYQTERQQYAVREPRPISTPGVSYPTRDALHDRPGLR